VRPFDFPTIELERLGENYRVRSRLDWRVLIMLAELGGWEPIDRGDEDSTYLRVPGVEIGYIEAYQIGYALMSILDDVPDFDIPLTGKIIPFEYFSGIRKQQIVAFATFCMRGEFEIR
jgi:hypothetical protein